MSVTASPEGSSLFGDILGAIATVAASVGAALLAFRLDFARIRNQDIAQLNGYRKSAKLQLTSLRERLDELYADIKEDVDANVSAESVFYITPSELSVISTMHAWASDFTKTEDAELTKLTEANSRLSSALMPVQKKNKVSSDEAAEIADVLREMSDACSGLIAALNKRLT